jgi:hypothetical protein
LVARLEDAGLAVAWMDREPPFPRLHACRRTGQKKRLVQTIVDRCNLPIIRHAQSMASNHADRHCDCGWPRPRLPILVSGEYWHGEHDVFHGSTKQTRIHHGKKTLQHYHIQLLYILSFRLQGRVTVSQTEPDICLLPRCICIYIADEARPDR